METQLSQREDGATPGVTGTSGKVSGFIKDRHREVLLYNLWKCCPDEAAAQTCHVGWGYRSSRRCLRSSLKDSDIMGQVTDAPFLDPSACLTPACSLPLWRKGRAQKVGPSGEHGSRKSELGVVLEGWRAWAGCRRCPLRAPRGGWSEKDVQVGWGEARSAECGTRGCRAISSGSRWTPVKQGPPEVGAEWKPFRKHLLS